VFSALPLLSQNKRRNMKLELLKNKRGKWFLHLKANNGRILMHSEDYDNKSNARKTMKIIEKGIGIII
jgi:uncharacterized protein YegP (UPF0339 family)